MPIPRNGCLFLSNFYHGVKKLSFVERARKGEREEIVLYNMHESVAYWTKYMSKKFVECNELLTFAS